MDFNYSVDINKLRQKQRARAKLGQSMQATINGALGERMPQQPQGIPAQPQTQNQNGWGTANA
jgi:hypothetical protein